MSSSKKIIVVGGNAAGPAAAAKAKRIDPTAEVCMYEAGDFVSTGTCELPYLLSGHIKNYEDIVFFSPQSFFEEKHVKVFTKHLVESIDRPRKMLKVRKLADGSIHETGYDTLILTTGSIANKIPKLTSNLKNVFYLKSVSDYLKIKRYLDDHRSNKVLIIGAGYIGLESTEAFKDLGMSVTVADKTELPVPSADVEIQHLVLETLKKHNVEFFGGSGELKFEIADDTVRSAELESRCEKFDLVLIATGVQPNSMLAANAGLAIGNFGGIKVDKKLRTSDPNIFAAGDNIEIINKITGRPNYMPLATAAHSCGHISGANAAGENLCAGTFVKNAVFKLFDKAVCTVGLGSSEAATNGFNFKSVNVVANNLVHVMPDSQKIFGKIIYESSTKKILGASFIGGREVSEFGNIISMMISNNLPADKLKSIDYNYTPPISPFVNLLSILGRKIK